MSLKKVTKNIYYDDKTDTYFVQFTFKDINRRLSFPTYTAAEEYRDAINDAKLEFKIKRDIQIIRDRERQEIIDEVPYPYNAFEDSRLLKTLVIDNEMIGNIDNILRDQCIPREVVFFELFYKDGYSLEDIGKRFEISRERVRQIIAKALRKLEYYIRNEIYRTPEEKLAHARIRMHQELIESFKRNPILTDELVKAFELTTKDFGVTAKNIEELGLSTRAFNPLKRAGIITVGDLITKDANAILRLKNLGHKSFKEIITKLDELGLKLYKKVQ